jgi:hypothetical protein
MVDAIAAFDDKSDADKLATSLRNDSGYDMYRDAVVEELTIYPRGDGSLKIRSRWGLMWIIGLDGNFSHREWPREQKYLADRDITSPAEWTSKVSNVPDHGYRVTCYSLTRDGAVSLAERVAAGVVEKIHAGIDPLGDAE